MTVEQWARPADDDELAKHPAAAFGKRAELAGWRVEYRYARGPRTTKRRPAEPDEHGKYSLVEATEIVDTIGVRAAHPDGRRIAAWWVGRSYDEGWAASPRRNARRLGIRDLTKYLTEIEENEPVPEQTDEQRSQVAADAIERLCEISATQGYDVDTIDPGHAWVDGYAIGHAAAAEEAGDSYGEGYAAGLAALSGHGRVWVKARRRLDSLRPGEVILGKGERWWTVAGSIERQGGRLWAVEATSGAEHVTVQGDAKRLVDVVESIAVADALAALKAEGIRPARADVSRETEAA